METDIVEYSTRCDICNRIKIEHQRPAGLLKPLGIPMWKWEDISMDFIVRLLDSTKRNDSVWVIVDKFTKVAHFIVDKTTRRVEKLAKVYMDNILKLHGAPISIVSD